MGQPGHICGPSLTETSLFGAWLFVVSAQNKDKTDLGN